ncbi:MAG: serine hydrolase [Acidobacteria bacterium]|nr:serine hydrolase [Acidobacteriota bacterium]
MMRFSKRAVGSRIVPTWALVIMTSIPLGCAREYTPSRESAARLAEEIQRAIGDFRGSVGIYAKDLETERCFELHADELFATASVFKVPVMIELFRRVESGEMKLGERRRIPDTISRRAFPMHTGILRYLQDPAELTVRDLCRLMIIVSDDIATDTLMETVDPVSVTSTMERLGFPNTRVSGNVTVMHYRMAGIQSRVGSPELDAALLARRKEGHFLSAGFADRTPAGNVTTPREMGRIFEKMHRGEIVSPEASRAMLEILKQTESRNMIPRHLPPDTVVAHKIGGTWRVKADAGIVYLPGRPMVMSIFTYYVPEEKRSADLIADLARILAARLPGSE